MKNEISINKKTYTVLFVFYFYISFLDNPLVKLSLGLYILYTQWKLPGKIPDGQLWPNACALKMTCADKYGFISIKWFNSNIGILFVEIFIRSKTIVLENDFIINFYKSIVFYRYFAVKRKKNIRKTCKNSDVRSSKVKEVIPCTFLI